MEKHKISERIKTEVMDAMRELHFPYGSEFQAIPQGVIMYFIITLDLDLTESAKEIIV